MAAGAIQASIGFDLAIATTTKASSESTAVGRSWVGGKSPSAGSSKIVNLSGEKGGERAMTSWSVYTTEPNARWDKEMDSRHKRLEGKKECKRRTRRTLKHPSFKKTTVASQRTQHSKPLETRGGT